jgi:hypothetical protein
MGRENAMQCVEGIYFYSREIRGLSRKIQKEAAFKPNTDAVARLFRGGGSASPAAALTSEI